MTPEPAMKIDWTLVLERGPAGRLSRTTFQGDDCAADVDDAMSAERERKDLHTAVDELNLEVSFRDWPLLSD